jgi:hypothetical protein
MARTQPFQFSLRTLLIGCAVLSLATALVISQYRAYDRWQHSISKVGGIGGFRGFNCSFDLVQLTSYRDRLNRPVAGILHVYDACSPNVPATTRDYSYSRRGVLFVDGELVDPARGPHLFVNGPYGHTVRLSPSPEEFTALFAMNGRSVEPQLEYWQQHVEPRIYKLTGSSIAGKRDGLWVYRLANDALYMEANYRQGERHGDWTTYFPNGKVQTRRQFEAGKPSGHWEYFDEEGKLLGTIDWKNGHVVRNEGERFTQGGSAGSGFFARNGVRTSHIVSEREGGKFFLDGKAIPRPEVEPSVLVPRD